MNIKDRIRPWIEKIKSLLQNRWFRTALQILILVMCGLYLYKNLKNILTSQVEFQINIYLLVISLGITIFTVLLGAFGFYLALKSLRMPIYCIEAINIHLQSNLAKYIPGYAWQLIGKAYLTKKTGVPGRMVGLVMTIELILLLLAGICMAILTLPVDIASDWQISNSVIRILPIIRIFSLALCFLFPFALTWVLNKTKISDTLEGSSAFTMFGALLSMFAGWISFGYSFWLLGKAFFPIATSQIPAFIFTLTTSIIIGLAIVIVPGSIGVRESIMVWLLGPIIGSPQAVIIAISSRLVVIISELVSAFTFRILKQRWNNPKVLVSQDISERRD